MNRLRKVMLLKSINQVELSKRTGISQSEISRIVNGKEIKLATAKKIARALDEAIEYLWPDLKKPPYSEV
jgi:transcriptional regulator with XRE-family HTH domain